MLADVRGSEGANAYVQRHATEVEAFGADHGPEFTGTVCNESMGVHPSPLGSSASFMLFAAIRSRRKK